MPEIPGQNDSDPPHRPTEDLGFLAAQQTREATSWVPWVIAAAVIILGVVILIVVGGSGSSSSQAAGTGLAPADAYASNLPIGHLQMSEATSFSGSKVTYVDGELTNTGQKTLDGITVQVGFHSETGEFAQRLSMPLSLIRTREPYVDTEPVSAAPIQPGQARDFRLIFDAIPADWNQQYPEIRVISVHSK